MAEGEHLEVIDTSRGLTEEELREIKRIVQASRILKWMITFIVGILGILTAIAELVGVDKMPWHR